MSSDRISNEYDFLILPNSAILLSIKDTFEGLPLIEAHGNMHGMASLASILLWLHANGDTEFLSITSLPFVENKDGLALSIRNIDDRPSNDYGEILRLDKDVQYEWRLSDNELIRLAITIHRLACLPYHEYDRFPIEKHGDAFVEFRLTNFGWLEEYWKTRNL